MRGAKLNLLINFLSNHSSRGFLTGSISNIATSAQITYRTYQRTLFKKYHGKQGYLLIGSLE
jgi:hypothetical protein